MPDDSARLLRSRLTARSATSVSVIAALSAGIGSAVFRSSPEKPTSTAANSQHRTKNQIIAGRFYKVQLQFAPEEICASPSSPWYWLS